jgi:hypothetical protein
VNDGSGLPRRTIDRRSAARLGVAAALILVLGALIGPTILTTPRSTHGPSAPGPSALATTTAVQPTATSAASQIPAPSPVPTLEPWPELLVPNFEPAAELQPTDVDRAGVAIGSSFTLRSLRGTPAVELARGLRIDPPTGLQIIAGATADVATIRPLEKLTVGLRYRLRLETPDGALAGTWAFITRAPLHIVGTLPGDRSVQVPTNTGIEVTFDQDGPTGLPDHFTIVPAVAGRFEPHERTWAFVPTKPLAEATIYTVTVTKGVAIEGSSEVLEDSETFQFETGIAGKFVPRIWFGRAILEVRPNVTPVVAVDIDLDNGEEEGKGEAPKPVGVTIHRLPTFAAVIAAATTVAGPEGWALASPSATVSTDGLTKVADVEAIISSSDAGDVLRIPVKLAAGSYIATIDQPGASAQLLLQVTNLSAYALTASKTTIVWVNDLVGDVSIAGAKVSTVGGIALGTTNANGLISTATPAELIGIPYPDSGVELSAFLLTVVAPDGRRLLVPIGLPVSWTYQERSWYAGDNEWWRVFMTDRSAYRQTDVVHVYGTIRARSDRSVPDDIEVRLRPTEGSPDAPILRVPVTATERGVFTADIPLDDLPRATYNVDLFVGRELVSSAWIMVTEIRKPAYRIELETDRNVYVVGDDVRITARASFFDGTAVPDLELRFGFEDRTQTAVATTDSLGEARAVLRVTSSDTPEGWFTLSVQVVPVRPEEGQISGSRSVVAFPSRAWLRAEASVTGNKIVMSGTITWADLAGFEAALDGGKDVYELDEGSGAPIPGGTVRATVTHLIPVRRQTGTTYDFIEKKVVPTYEYDINEVDMGSSTLTAAANGTFRLSMAAPVPDDGYRITLSTVDPEGRKFLRIVHASMVFEEDRSTPPWYLAASDATDPLPNKCGFVVAVRTGLDEPVSLTLHEGNGDVAADGHYLYLVGRRGSVEATLLDESTFSRVMRDADLPDFTVRVVGLTDDGYVVADAEVALDLAGKAITIALKPDKPGYRPGDPVRIDVMTTDSSGDPISADVVVHGVDEKLFTLGLAFDTDPLGTLMARTSSGFLQAYRSHGLPRPDYGGCGAEGGGGERDDFQDTVTFQRITTNAAGRGSVAFNLSDDLTSWHMSAMAFSGTLDAGQASVLIPVGLPFFVEAVLAPEYLVGDMAVLRLRAYGGALTAADHVQFVVEAPSLGLLPTTIDGVAFDALRLSLPSLSAGEHAIRIRATVTHAGKTLRDSLTRTVRVVESRLGSLAASYDVLQPGFVPQGGDGLTTYVITDAGRGRLISLLEELASSTSARFDRSAAAELARDLLIDEYGFPAVGLVSTGYAGERYQRDGIALLPYGSTDLFLSAKAALVAGSKVDADQLRWAFREWASNDGAQRERRIVAFTGLAALGDDVLEQLRAYDPATLTIREQLWLGLGFAAAGDDASARAIERQLLDTNGQRLGPWVRLTGGTTLDQSLEASGLLLLLAARLGDPLAHDVSRFLIDHPSREFVFPLEQIGYVQGMLDWLPRVAGRFAWTVGGERHEVELTPGGAFALLLTKGQRTTLAFERLEGELAVVTTWTATNAGLPSDPTVTIKRTITPAGNAPDDRLVRVRIEVTFGPAVTGGCYRITDLLPSGLAPLVAGRDWYGDTGDQSVIYPYESDGQRVSWCSYASDTRRVYGYAARVVSPGTYRWEPAVIQSEVAPTVGSSIPEVPYTIR